MYKLNIIIFLSFIFSVNVSVFAIEIDQYNFQNEQQIAKYEKIINSLRCLVCQNQTIADSDADLAKDVREVVAQKVIAGETEQQIKEFFIQRYGEFIDYNPQLNLHNVWLWLAPFIILIITVITIFTRKKSK